MAAAAAAAAEAVAAAAAWPKAGDGIACETDRYSFDKAVATSEQTAKSTNGLPKPI